MLLLLLDLLGWPARKLVEARVTICEDVALSFQEKMEIL